MPTLGTTVEGVLFLKFHSAQFEIECVPRAVGEREEIGPQNRGLRPVAPQPPDLTREFALC
jgi:hypothetical protein